MSADTFAAFDRSCGEELESLCEYLLETNPPGDALWVQAILIRSMLNEARKGTRTMNITQVVVEIHEKRANPSAMGHYDAKVEYTAEVTEGEDANKVVGALQFLAGQHVALECNRWVAGVKLEDDRNAARSTLNWAVSNAKGSIFTDIDAKHFEENLALLPEGEWAGYRSKLEKAIQEFRSDTREYLDKLLVEATENGRVSRWDKDVYDHNLTNLPEDEHAGYRLLLEQALAPKPDAEPVKVVGKEDTPF